MVNRSFLSILGPGILYAAAAVGISHLVHSTHAGATYGMAMVPFLLLSCLVKYPALRFGNEFAAVTGRSLVDSYLSFGRWTIWIFGLSQLFSMVFVIAAISLVTTGLLKTVFAIPYAPLAVNACLLAASSLILITGRYHLLERITKGIVLIFTILILLATYTAVGRIAWPDTEWVLSELDTRTIFYIIALVGFMPTPLDASVLQSLWARAKAKDSGYLASPAEARLDFNVGYLITIALAICFVMLGMAVMFGSGVRFESSAAGFANQLIALFTVSVGEWAYYPIGLAAVTVMLSTLLTVMDGYPRVIDAIVIDLLPDSEGRMLGRRFYDWVLLFISVMSLIVLSLFMTNFAAFIDMTSVIVFLMSPLIAWLNHRSMFGRQVPRELQPGGFVKIWSAGAILIMMAVAVAYLYLRINGQIA